MGYLPNAALFATIGDILVSLRIIPSLKGAGKCLYYRAIDQLPMQTVSVAA